MDANMTGLIQLAPGPYSRWCWLCIYRLRSGRHFTATQQHSEARLTHIISQRIASFCWNKWRGKRAERLYGQLFHLLFTNHQRFLCQLQYMADGKVTLTAGFRNCRLPFRSQHKRLQQQRNRIRPCAIVSNDAGNQLQNGRQNSVHG